MTGLGKPGMYKAGSGLLPKDIHSLHAHPTRALAAPRVVCTCNARVHDIVLVM